MSWKFCKMLSITLVMVACSDIEDEVEQEGDSLKAILAVRDGDLDMLKEVSARLDLTQVFSGSYAPDSTLLHAASNCEIARFLINEGLELHQVQADGMTPFLEAAAQGWPDMIDCYVSMGVPLSQRTARSTLYPVPSKIVPESYEHTDLIRKHPDIHFAFWEGGMTALHLAASHSAINSLQKLLDLGMEPDIRGARDLTPLHAAILSQAKESVALLLQAGADPELKTESGLSAYELAAMDLPDFWFGPISEESVREIRELLDSSSAQ